MVRQTGQCERETCHLRRASMKAAVYRVHATARIHLSQGAAITRSPPSRCDLWICREESSRIFRGYSDSVHECIMESDEREYILGLDLHVLDALFGHLLNDRVPELVDDGRRSKRTLSI